ncbi:hypothetical protein ABPG77_010105 [Micractinium sp. CCAP 211/92]
MQPHPSNEGVEHCKHCHEGHSRQHLVGRALHIAPIDALAALPAIPGWAAAGPRPADLDLSSSRRLLHGAADARAHRACSGKARRGTWAAAARGMRGLKPKQQALREAPAGESHCRRTTQELWYDGSALPYSPLCTWKARRTGSVAGGGLRSTCCAALGGALPGAMIDMLAMAAGPGWPSAGEVSTRLDMLAKLVAARHKSQLRNSIVVRVLQGFVRVVETRKPTKVFLASSPLCPQHHPAYLVCIYATRRRKRAGWATCGRCQPAVLLSTALAACPANLVAAYSSP